MTKVVQIFSGVLLCLLLSYSFGFSANTDMQDIQKELTQNYLNTQNSVAIQKTENMVLDSKIEGLMLEDIIAGYDSDIAVIEKKMIPLFEQLKEPKIKISKKEEQKIKIREALTKQAKILSSLYLEMLFQEELKEKNFSDSILYQFFITESEAVSGLMTEDSLKKMEKKVLSSYIELLKQFKEIQKDQEEIKVQMAPIHEKYEEFSAQKDKILQQKSIKEEKLSLAKEQKEHYEGLLEESREQAFASMEEAMKSDNALQELQAKLNQMEVGKEQKEANETARRMQDIELKDEYSPEELTSEMVALISKKVLEEANDGVFSLWPVEAKKGISATFHDAEYKKRFGMQHNAIDIPSPQGTPILAPADGYVYKTADNGMGYSYIILLHRNNIRTVYGHVSGFTAKAGSYVTEGQQIGKVGGTPGTRGAGKMTTGSHLHFEVLVNEVYKNPLNYLPKK